MKTHSDAGMQRKASGPSTRVNIPPCLSRRECFPEESGQAVPHNDERVRMY